MLVAILAITWSCQKDDIENFSQNEQLVLKSQPVPGDYDIAFSYVGETTLTFEIDQSGARNISHMLFQFIDCEGEYLSIDNIISATVNGNDWKDKTVSNSGFDYNCDFDLDLPFIKLDDFEFDKVDIVTVVIKLDTKVANVDYLIKSANECFVYSEVTEICGPDDFPPTIVCEGETAWSFGPRYNVRGNWATYTPYDGDEKTVDLFAGQTRHAGTVHFSAVDGGKVTITIEMEEDWSLQDVSDAIKVQGYNGKAPSGNPAPGRFRTYKGNELSFTVDAFEFFGIHVDIQYCYEVYEEGVE